MTEKQERFCRAYLKNLTVSKAAREAGYSKAAGYKLIKKDEVQQYIKEHIKSLETEEIADEKEILTKLTAIIRDESTDLKSKLKALEIMGRRYQLFKDKKEVESGSTPVIIISGESNLED